MDKQKERDPVQQERVNDYLLETWDERSLVHCSPEQRAEKSKSSLVVFESHDDTIKGPGRLINHSFKHPNAELKVKDVRLRSGQFKKFPYFVAAKKIRSGEEVFWNYGDHAAARWWYLTCWCSKCKGVCHCAGCQGQQRHEPDQPLSQMSTHEFTSSQNIESLTQRTGPHGLDAFLDTLRDRNGHLRLGRTSADNYQCGVDAIHHALMNIGVNERRSDIVRDLTNLSLMDRPNWFSFQVIYLYLLKKGFPFVLIDATSPETRGARPELRQAVLVAHGVENIPVNNIVGIVLTGARHWQYITSPDDYDTTALTYRIDYDNVTTFEQTEVEIERIEQFIKLEVQAMSELSDDERVFEEIRQGLYNKNDPRHVVAWNILQTQVQQRERGQAISTERLSAEQLSSILQNIERHYHYNSKIERFLIVRTAIRQRSDFDSMTRDEIKKAAEEICQSRKWYDVSADEVVSNLVAEKLKELYSVPCKPFAEKARQRKDDDDEDQGHGKRQRPIPRVQMLGASSSHSSQKGPAAKEHAKTTDTSKKVLSRMLNMIKSQGIFRHLQHVLEKRRLNNLEKKWQRKAEKEYKQRILNTYLESKTVPLEFCQLYVSLV